MDTILETRDSIRFTRLNKRARRAQVTLEVNLPDGCTEAQAKAYLNAALALDKRVSAPVDLPIDPMGQAEGRAFAFRVTKVEEQQVEQVARPKRVKCTCKRCGGSKYLPAATTDTTEPYLCPKCDDLFIAWQNEASEGPEEGRRTLEAFLARRPQR